MSETCLNCGKIWGDHYDGDFCDTKHSQAWRASAPPAEGGVTDRNNPVYDPIAIAIRAAAASDAIYKWQFDDAAVAYAALSQRVRELEEENVRLKEEIEIRGEMALALSDRSFAHNNGRYELLDSADERYDAAFNRLSALRERRRDPR